MSLFITFEGGEGCGKTTQAKALCRRLIRQNIPVILIHEPGGTQVGERIRRLLKESRNIPILPLTELLLFNASRAQLVNQVIKPALAEGKIVICDRFTDSTIAYQHYGRGLDLEVVEEINKVASQGLTPDLTFLLDIAPDIGLSRKEDGIRDRFQSEDLDFHRRVREGFHNLAMQDSRRWLMLDASASREEIAGLVWDRVSVLLGLKKVPNREALSKHIQFISSPPVFPADQK